MARALWFLIAATLAVRCSTGDRDAPGEASRLSVSFVDDFNISSGTRYPSLGDAELGGISAIVYDAETKRWVALSDAREQSRLYEFDVVYQGGELDVAPLRSTYLRDMEGRVFAENVLDPEGIARTPWGTLLVSTEADSRTEPVHQSRLLEFDVDGRLLRELVVPDKFLVEGWPPEKGVRHNLSFESLTLSPSGNRLFLGAEQALLQDGPQGTFDRPGFCRIIEYRISETREIVPHAEYVYPLGPVPAIADVGEVELDVGLVELIALEDSRLLALERDYIGARGGEDVGINRVRLVMVDLAEATDVSSVARLDPAGAWRPVKKELLLDLDDVVPELSPGFRKLDNFEAMGLGPQLSDGGRGLLLVSDDNFRESQRSAFFLFSMKAVAD